MVELLVESLPATVIGFVIFFQQGGTSDYGEIALLVFSICLSVISVYTTVKLVLRKSSLHGISPLDYVYYRILFSDAPSKRLTPFMGKLQDGSAKGVNYSGHEFSSSDVTTL